MGVGGCDAPVTCPALHAVTTILAMSPYHVGVLLPAGCVARWVKRRAQRDNRRMCAVGSNPAADGGFSTALGNSNRRVPDVGVLYLSEDIT